MSLLDLILLSLQRTVCRWRAMLVLTATMAVLSAAVAVVWSAHRAWSEQARTQVSASGIDRVTVTATRDGPPISSGTIDELGRINGVRKLVPCLNATVYVEGPGGDFKPVMTSSFVRDDPFLDHLPLVELGLQPSYGGPSIVLAPNLLQRLGYQSRGMTGQEVRVRAMQFREDGERRSSILRCRVSAVVGDLGMEGARLDFDTMASIVLYQSGNIDQIPGAAEGDENAAQVAEDGEDWPNAMVSPLDHPESAVRIPPVAGDVSGLLRGEAEKADDEGTYPGAWRAAPAASVALETADQHADAAPLLDRLTEIHAVQLYVDSFERLDDVHRAVEQFGYLKCESAYYEHGRREGLLVASLRMATPMVVILAISAVWGMAFITGGAVGAERPLISLWRSVGARRVHIFLIYLFQTLWVSAAGAIVGTLIAVYLVNGPGQDMGDRLAMQLFADVPLVANITIGTVIGVLSGLVPAVQSAQGDVTRGIRESGVIA